MLLDEISRKAHRVVCSVNVFDIAGVTMAHRGIINYFRESATGDANSTVLGFSTRTSFFVGTTSVARNLFALFKRIQPLPNVELLESNAFESASSSFSANFEPSAMPHDIGGTLRSGTDLHCCLGVEQSPRLDDADALWRHYKELTPAKKKVRPAAAARNYVSAVGRAFAAMQSRIVASVTSEEAKRTGNEGDESHLRDVELATYSSSQTATLPTVSPLIIQTNPMFSAAPEGREGAGAQTPVMWSEHKKDGTTFYFNEETGVSSWTRPSL